MSHMALVLGSPWVSKDKHIVKTGLSELMVALRIGSIPTAITQDQSIPPKSSASATTTSTNI